MSEAFKAAIRRQVERVAAERAAQAVTEPAEPAPSVTEVLPMAPVGVTESGKTANAIRQARFRNANRDKVLAADRARKRRANAKPAD